MARVEDEDAPGRVEAPVQGEGKFDPAQVRPRIPARRAHRSLLDGCLSKTFLPAGVRPYP